MWLREYEEQTTSAVGVRVVVELEFVLGEPKIFISHKFWFNKYLCRMNISWQFRLQMLQAGDQILDLVEQLSIRIEQLVCPWLKNIL